ncbi:MAG TPA: hypothetical protein VLM42_05035 [Bryobacteraceae bacterium]|nr:hypothetical protein [Bryobacteraceae bacterium]
MLAVFGFGSFLSGASGSIRDIDFKNFTYPFYADDDVGVPGNLTWNPTDETRLITLHNGRYKVACDAPALPPPRDPKVPNPELCPSITGGGATFGHINGLPQASAIVVVTYHSGGTSQWSYLYVVIMHSGKPQVVAWIETGSRADMGLRDFSFDHGDLVVVVNDPQKRQGDCCSLGTITTRYRWQNGAFKQIGSPILADDPR